MLELVDSRLIMVPLSRLSPTSNGVRRTNGISIDNLAASIRAEGLIQNLTVVVDPESPLAGADEFQGYQVVAGSRRLRAMRKLITDGEWPPDREVPCKLVTAAQALSASLAENVIREPMHPADEFVAYREMIEEGKSIEDIAARFGVTQLAVQRRLKLANVAPRLFELYREGAMTLEQITALALSDDHDAQERAWFGVDQDWQQAPYHLRQALTKKEVSLTKDPLARFVGRDAYMAAGGVIHEDLFSDEGEGYVSDLSLLQTIAAKKLDEAADPVRKEAWSWVDIRPAIDYSELSAFRRIDPIGHAKPDDAEKKSIKALTTERNRIDKMLGDENEKDIEIDEYALTEKRDDISDQLEAMEIARAKWDPKQLAQAGAMVTIEDGRLKIYRGLVKGKVKLSKPSKPGMVDGDESPTKKAEAVGHSDALDVDLTTSITAAIAAEFVANPGMAIIALTHRLVLATFYNEWYGDLIKIARERGWSQKKDIAANDCVDIAKLEKEHAAIAALLPKKLAELAAWLQTKDAPVSRLLAYCVATSADAMTTSGKLRPHAATFARALNLDMKTRWTPRKENYLSRVSADQIRACLKDAGVDKVEIAATEKMQKAELANHAEKLLASRNWIPKIMRFGDRS